MEAKRDALIPSLLERRFRNLPFVTVARGALPGEWEGAGHWALMFRSLLACKAIGCHGMEDCIIAS